MSSPKYRLMLRPLFWSCGPTGGGLFQQCGATGVMVILLIVLAFAGRVQAQQPGSIVGRWHSKDAVQEITADFGADGSFYQVLRSASGRMESRGRYRLTGRVLVIEIDGEPQPLQSQCRFTDADTLVLTYPTGEVIRAQRVRSGTATQSAASAQPATPSNQTPTPKPQPVPKTAAPATPASGMGGSRPVTILLQRVWEPNEKAFTVLVPRGWATTGGIFNVNPLKTNGPGNTISPKCDFSVRSDERGTLMLRWVPSWNYADLTLSPTGHSLFRPGQYYQGMLVKLLVTPRQFLTELLRAERPQASGLRVIAEDPMQEIAEAYSRKSQQINAQLRQMNLAPNRFECLAMLVEYSESGRLFRESVMTTIADARGGAFMWSNDDTVMFRAPADEFDAWKPVLDMVRSSRKMNPQWVAAVTKAMGQRAQAALETQQYINRVAHEIVENRRRTHAEIRHENWLFISGQEEYKNPFTGEIERGTSAYPYRWENNQGDVLYTDQNGFDPNRIEQYNTREWKRSQVWDRKK
jgi:hypothetical protein